MFVFDPNRLGRLRPWFELLVHGWRLGRVYDIEIRVHFLLVAMVAFDLVGGLVHLLRGSIAFAGFLFSAVLFWLVLFGSVLLHELGHCYGAWLVGGRARSVLLWPLGGLASVEGSEKAPSAELAVTLFGPAMNLVLAVPAHLAVWLLLRTDLLGGSTAMRFVVAALVVLYRINYAMFLFNMLLPIFPMDAARVVRSLLAMRMPAARATYLVCTLGLWICGLGVLAVLLGGGRLSVGDVPLDSWILLIFILGAFTCTQTRAMLRYGQVYTSESNWGGRSAYLHTTRDWRLAELRGHWLRPLRRAGRARAQVIDLDAPPDTARTLYLRRLRELDDLLKDAVRREDFDRARRLKEQIAALRRENE